MHLYVNKTYKNNNHCTCDLAGNLLTTVFCDNTDYAVHISIWYDCLLLVCNQNLATVKSFNICLEFEDTQEVFVSLYKLFFGIVK